MHRLKTAWTMLACLLACQQVAAAAQAAPPAANAERGRAAIARHGCVACHVVPGMDNPGSNVGPPLDKVATRGYIAGVLANTPANMERWLRDPPAVDPLTAMPNLHLSEQEVRDIAAYLYTLK